MDVGTTQLGIILDSDALEGPKLNFPSHSMPAWNNRGNTEDSVSRRKDSLMIYPHVPGKSQGNFPDSQVRSFELGFASQLYH